ncbi:MAG: substrate-binding domain-containing protein [Pseudomonadota bacterium]|nr:substrate-binding domain-containing protein [Pseudomonadota bacterium]
MKKLLVLCAAALLASCDEGGKGSADGSSGANASGAAGAVWGAGSSTVFPFASRVSESYARKTGDPAPRIEALGTGGGIKAFCSGLGEGSPDIALASRPMKASEFDSCVANGVTAVTELRVGSDGVVIATARNGADYALTLEQIYRALAAETPTPGDGFAPNRVATWREVAASLPAQRIQVYGPPPTSGTRDAFIELGMQAGAKQVPAMAALAKSDEDAFEARASRIREDGAWIDSGENDNAIVQTLTRTPGALGVFGFSFLNENRDRVKPATVAGAAPTAETIADGRYPLARSLYLYVKKDAVGRKPGVRSYIAEFLSDAAAGPGGYLAEQGMIPLPPAQLAASRQAATALPSMARPAS